MAEPTQQALAAILDACGVGLAPTQLDQLWAFHGLLRARNDDGDLTRLRAFDTIARLHYVDCLLAAKFLAEQGPLPSPLLDAGTGAGFPGIPLAIALPELRLLLCEGRARRVQFLQDAVQLLGLEGRVQVFGHQIHAGTHLPKPVQGIVTRALERVPPSLARFRAHVPAGGVAVFLKGPNCDDEIDEAKRLCADDWRAGFQRAYGIPGTTHRRRLLVYDRRDNPRELRRRAPREVDSAANPSFRQWKSLLQAKGVKDEGLMLLAGARTVPEALRDLPHACVELLVPRGTADVPPETPPGLPVNVIGKELFRELDAFGTGRPLLVLRAPDIAPWDGEIHGLTLAVPFQDPENVGAVLRSAAAFGVETVVLLQEAAHPGHPKALRAGGTAALRLGLRRGPKLSEIARLCRGPIVALSADGTPLDRLDWPEACLLVPGLEGPGLPEDLRAQAVAIPMADGAESLNAATAVAVALYAWAAGGGKTVAGPPG